MAAGNRYKKIFDMMSLAVLIVEDKKKLMRIMKRRNCSEKIRNDC